ncbi:MAG: DoxX family protein [Candidatus Yanofskybacteria bacterium]|nr:DoxX family protein [Candidatus Yanofskybacteria bacterium]
MNKNLQRAIASLRISLGVMFLYAGLTKVLDPNWTSAGYLKAAKTFPDVYAWFASSGNIGWVDFINKWGLTAIGVALILGIYLRWASLAGSMLMALYYLPILDFPYVGDHSFIVDEHIIYMAGFCVLWCARTSEYWNFVPASIKRKLPFKYAV